MEGGGYLQKYPLTASNGRNSGLYMKFLFKLWLCVKQHVGVDADNTFLIDNLRSFNDIFLIWFV